MGELYNQLLERLDRVITERDVARAEVEQLKVEVQNSNARHEATLVALRQKRQQRDEAHAEAERVNKQLEQAIAERTPHDYGILKEEAQEMRKQRDEARAEVEQLKQVLHDARLENSGQAAQLERKRPEPSRLEIAATLVASRFSSTSYVTEIKGTWIQYALKGADALIAAAKEGK